MSALGTNISTIPVLDVHSYNVMDVWPSLRIAINSSQFISIDLVSSLMMLVHILCVCYPYPNPSAQPRVLLGLMADIRAGKRPPPLSSALKESIMVAQLRLSMFVIQCHICEHSNNQT